MKRQKRAYLFDIFDSAEGAFDLFQNSIRSGMDYDSNINDQFLATVLTIPVKVTGERTPTTFVRGGKGKGENFAFMVRLEGKNSPHRFLPDPCDIEYTNNADDRRLVFNLIQQHTKVIMSTDSSDRFPEPGDKIVVTLERNQFGSFKTDVAKNYVKFVEEASTNTNPNTNCQRLSDTFKFSEFVTPGARIATSRTVAFRGYGYKNAGYLFDFIAGREGDIDSYNTGVSGVTTGYTPPSGKTISQMTIGEIKDAQKVGLFAVGKYQIIPVTMIKFAAFLDNDSLVFNEETQDRFVEYVVRKKRKKIDNYLDGGKTTLEDAALEVAAEFASVGVPRAMKAGEYRSSRPKVPAVDIVQNASLYYKYLNGNNQAFTSTEDIQEILKQARAANTAAASTTTP